MARCTRYNILIRFVSDFRQVGGFLPVSPTNKTDRHDIAEISLRGFNPNSNTNVCLAEIWIIKQWHLTKKTFQWFFFKVVISLKNILRVLWDPFARGTKQIDRHNWNTMHGGENVAPGWICDYYHIQRPVYLYNILKDNFIYVFTTTYAISAYHHLSCELKSRAWGGALDSTLCGKNCQWLAPGFLLVLWFPPPIQLTSTI